MEVASGTSWRARSIWTSLMSTPVMRCPAAARERATGSRDRTRCAERLHNREDGFADQPASGRTVRPGRRRRGSGRDSVIGRPDQIASTAGVHGEQAMGRAGRRPRGFLAAPPGRQVSAVWNSVLAAASSALVVSQSSRRSPQRAASTFQTPLRTDNVVRDLLHRALEAGGYLVEVRA